MGVPETKASFPHGLLAAASAAVLIAAACAPPAAAPTTAPAKPAPTAAPAKPAPTTAPAKPAATTAPAKPAATAAPAAKPTEKPAAKAAEFDEKAVADFYKGKTVRIVVAMAPGGTTDTNARMLQKVLGKYIPGNPTVVVENKPGGGGLLAANTVYNSEAKDGTVIAAFNSQLVLQQAIGAPGVQFDGARYNWLASTYESFGICAVRTDAGFNSIQDVMEGGKELTVSSYGKGTPSYDPPAIFNATLGTRFKIVMGYEGGAQQRQAVRNKEVQGFCVTLTGGTYVDDLLGGDNPIAKVLIVTGPETPNHPVLKGVPAAEKLAKTDEAKKMLRIVHDMLQFTLPLVVAPEVPKDRVQALRRGLDKSFADPEYRAAAEKAQLVVTPRTGEELTRMFQDLLRTPPATLAKLKEALL